MTKYERDPIKEINDNFINYQVKKKKRNLCIWERIQTRKIVAIIYLIRFI